MYKDLHRTRAIAIAAPRPIVQTQLLLWVVAFALAALVVPICAANGATYYIATNGNDGAAGTSAAPWRTVTHALPDLNGGDTVIWANGTYTESIDLALLPLTSAPVVLKAATPRAVTLRGGGAFFTIGSRDHVKGAVRIEGFKITDGAMGAGFDTTGDNIEINNCEIYGTIEGFRLRGGSNLKLIDNYMHDNQYGFIMGVKDVSGITGITIERCVAANNAQAGQTGNTDGFVIEGYSSNVVIRDCVSYGAGDAGFDIKPAGTLVERCLSYNNKGMGMKLWGSNVKVINCIVYNSGLEGIGTAGDNLQFWGCTIANNPDGALRVESTNSQSITVRNCIFYNNHVWLFGTNMYNDDYNCYYSTSGSYVIRTASTTYTAAQVNAHTVPVGSNSIGQNPLMVSPGTGDFRLSSSSPCNGAGVANSLVALDYYAATRQNPPDIGAIENGSGTAPIIPTAPTTVVITAGASAGVDLDLAAQASGSTVSNGATISYDYQWSKSTDSGATWGAWGYAGQTLPKSNLAAGQQWKARACASVDDVNYSSYTQSAVTTIGAPAAVAPTAPTSVSVTPSPTAAVTTDLQAAATGSVSSTGGTIDYQYHWSASTDSGATWGAWGNAGNILLKGNLAVGQMWKARARATVDDVNYSAWTVSGTVSVVDGTTATPKRPDRVTITPSAPKAGDVLTATVSPAAPAGITYQFQWRVYQSGKWAKWGYSNCGDTLPSYLVKAGQKWQARARATNGTTNSTYKASMPVTVTAGTGGTNQAPSAPTSVAITPTVPQDGEDLTPQASGATDPNGTAVTYQYRWHYSQDGGATWNQYSILAVLNAGLTGVGEKWKVEARAYDGTLYGPWLMSAPVTITN